VQRQRQFAGLREGEEVGGLEDFEDARLGMAALPDQCFIARSYVPALTWLLTWSNGVALGRLGTAADLGSFVFFRMVNTLWRNRFMVVSLAAQQPLGL
jgi:hypothetical protein